jgi:hypothetical protein
MRDFWLALRSSWYYFRREYRRRVQATQRKAMPDPLAVPRFEMGKFIQGSEFNNVADKDRT